jgi:hypothetical protein
MPAPAWDNLDEFFDPRDFGTVALIRFAPGGSRQVNGIFDDPYLRASAADYDKDDARTTLMVKASDAAGVKRLDFVDIDGVTYDVLTSPQPDGTGMAHIALAKQ